MDYLPSDAGAAGWRYILPIVQTLLYCALVLWGFRERYPSKAIARRQPSQYVRVQEGEGEWKPRYIDAPPPQGFLIAWSLDLPAVVPALLILVSVAMLVRHLGSLFSDLLACAGSGLFVPFLWYGVGWWIDDRLGRFPPRLFRFSSNWQGIVVAFALVLSLPTLLVSSISLIAAVATGEIARHGELLVAMFGWSAWLSWISIVRARCLAGGLPKR